jgi:hypothetical protein
MVRLAGEKLMVRLVTCTTWLAGVQPGADAPMVADPLLIPVTCGCVAGIVAPCTITTLDGVTVTFDGSLLTSVTVTPPAAAGADKFTGNGIDWPGAKVTFAGRLIDP